MTRYINCRQTSIAFLYLGLPRLLDLPPYGDPLVPVPLEGAFPVPRPELLLLPPNQENGELGPLLLVDPVDPEVAGLLRLDPLELGFWTDPVDPEDDPKGDEPAGLFEPVPLGLSDVDP